MDDSKYGEKRNYVILSQKKRNNARPSRKYPRPTNLPMHPPNLLRTSLPNLLYPPIHHERIQPIELIHLPLHILPRSPLQWEIPIPYRKLPPLGEEIPIILVRDEILAVIRIDPFSLCPWSKWFTADTIIGVAKTRSSHAESTSKCAEEIVCAKEKYCSDGDVPELDQPKMMTAGNQQGE